MTDVPTSAPGGSPASVVYVRKVVVSWALYDLANTIYSAIVMTAFLVPLYKQHYGSYTPVGIATSVTLLLSAFASTRFGGNVDRTGRARPGLDLWSNVCVVATAALFFAIELGSWPTLFVYGASLFAYQAALTYYNALLPVVAPIARRGFVSGLGVGLGYAGIPIALLISKFMLARGIEAQAAFLLSAVLMTLGTIPLWLHVKDRPSLDRAAPDGAARVTPTDSPTLLSSLRWARSEPALGMLLLANFVCADVANTLIQYATSYFQDYLGWTLTDAVTALIALSMTALVGGLVVGRLADRARPARLYAGACGALVVGLVLAGVLPGSPISVAALVVTGGVGISTIWTVGRLLVLQVAPPSRHGEAMGLYGVTTKASIVGTTMFAILRDATGSFFVPILVQAAVLALGVVLVVVAGRRLPVR